jgi:hypothetical protein
MKKKTMLDVSQEIASAINSYASIIAIAAGFVTAGAGVLTYMSASTMARYSDEAIAKANSVSAEANNAAAQANAKTETLTQQNLELQIRLEKERKERLELQKSVERRSISEKQRKEIIDTSKKIQKKLKIKIHCNAKDTEARAYVQQIGQLLHDQGHYAEGIEAGIIVQMDSANIGVYLLIYDTPHKLDVLALLALTGIATEIVQLNTPDPNGFHAELTVLPKPPYIG